MFCGKMSNYNISGCLWVPEKAECLRMGKKGKGCEQWCSGMELRDSERRLPTIYNMLNKHTIKID